MKKTDVLVKLPFVTFWLSEFRDLTIVYDNAHKNVTGVSVYLKRNCLTYIAAPVDLAKVPELYDECSGIISDAFIEFEHKQKLIFKVKGKVGLDSLT